MAENKRLFKQIISSIKEAKTIALFCHISADVDALGSMYGLYQGLKTMGKQVDMFAHEKLRSEKKLIFDESMMQFGAFKPEKYDLLISVDVATKDRLGDYKDGFAAHPNTIKIDHHRVGNSFARVNYVDYEKSSCSEIVFQLLEGMRAKITPDNATLIYAGLSSDTHSFVNNNTNKDSFKAAIKLIEKNADILAVNIALNRSISKDMLNMKKFLYSNMEIIDNEIALIVVSMKDLEKAGCDYQDCDNYSAELISIEGINVSVSIVEREAMLYACSFRSMPGYSVSLIAQRLGGGGHVEAAGCKIRCSSPHEAHDVVLDAIRKYLKSRNPKND